MSKFLTFQTALIIALLMTVLAAINTGSKSEPQLNPPFIATLLVWLVFASIVPVVMVPIGVLAFAYQVLNSNASFLGWINDVSKGPAKNAQSNP